MRLNLPITDIEYPIPEREVLVSKTDLKGVITYCNIIFIEVSGYSRDELLGAPHNLLRHPDMPQQAYADLWQTIQADKPWRGMVKNRRKDGSYYWVEANVTPLHENGKTVGYVSFRYQATPEQVEQAEAAYRAIRDGSTSLRIAEGKIVRVENRLLHWLSVRSIKVQLLAFMSVLLGALVVAGIFNLRDASNAHDRSVDGLAIAGVQAYALDTARTTELDFKEQLHAWKDILIRGHDAASLEQYLHAFDRHGDEVEYKLGLLKPIMLQIGLPVDSVDTAIEMHMRLNSQYHQALKDFDIHKAESGRLIDGMVKGTDRSFTDQIEKIIATIQSSQQDRLGELNAMLEASHHADNQRSIVMLAIAALLGLFLSMRFISGILKPIQRADRELNKTVQMQQQFLEIILRLEMYRDRIDEEQRIGSYIMGRITNIHGKLDPLVRHLIRPAEHFSGDMLLASRTPADALHILLADAVGHGMTAAVNVLPLSQTFEAMSEKGFSITHIAEELNKKINQFMPVDRFVSAALISINRQTRVIEVWNGGIPALQLFNRDGHLIQNWPSRHLPLGILPDEEFAAKPEVFRYEEECQLCLFSDGLMEASSPQGEPFGYARIAELFATTAPESRFDALVAQFDQHLQGQSAHDDISLALVDISTRIDQDMLSCRVAAHAVKEKSDDWRIAISLGANELKYLDVVPLLTQIIAKIHVTREHNSALFLILSELFNNAFDHGVLRLDSNLKLGADGFEKFLELRDTRMQALSSGKIEIEIERVLIESQQAVKIRVADSGDGFDYTSFQTTGTDQLEQAQHGRGIALTRSLVYKLEYAGKGNEVTAYYICA